MEGAMVENKVQDDERILGNKRGRDEKCNTGGRLEKKPSGMVVIDDYSGDEMINGVKYEEEKKSGGGLLSQLVTNLVGSPRSNQSTDVSKAEPEKNGGGDGDGGGVINNLFSNIFNGNGNGNGGGEVVEKDDGGEKEETEKDDGGEENDNIVAKLPRTLSEDPAPVPAPATDEASILLHSIIHD